MGLTARMTKPKRRGLVTGIGGIFFKAREPEALARWYRERLGFRIEGTVGVFTWKSSGPRGHKGHTVWAIFPADTEYFGRARQAFMINFRVRELDATLSALRKAGAEVDPKIDESEYGRFGWVTDPEGNRIELWEPPKAYRPPEKQNPME
jgi:predicted enzyme related to lactoylglutathione lyase